MTSGVDVLVVGGGPVGLAAALEVDALGLSVLVVEPRTAPVDKACGEGLMPGAVKALARLGVDPPGRPIVGIRYVGTGGASMAEHRFSDGAGRGVRRPELSAALARRVAEEGVEVATGRVTGVVQDGAGVRADVQGAGAVHASWLLACDGLHSPTRKRLGLDGGSDGRRYGLRRHAAVPPWTDHVEVHWSPVAEAYVTPVAVDEVGVAVLGGRGLGFVEALQGFPVLRDRLSGAVWSSPARGAGPLRQRARARTSGRVLLVGDAGGYVDALTGEGLRIGFASAAAAARAVAAGRPGLYEREWARITGEYRRVTSSLLLATRVPLVRKALVPAAARLPSVFGGLVESLAR